MPGLFGVLLARLSFWSGRARTRRQLRDLPPHLLDDIGVNAAVRDVECAKLPWQGIGLNDEGDAKENGRCLRTPVRSLAVDDRF